MRRADTIETWTLRLTRRPVADDHHGVVVLRETASRPDGATLDINEVHVLAINSEGQITDLWDLPTDPELHDNFLDGR